MIEYKVRPVSRYIVTRFEQNGSACASSVIGEFPSRQLARDVAIAFQGGDADFEDNKCTNILPAQDVPAMLRNIAEDSHDIERGIVYVMTKDGEGRVYGLGAKVGDPNELIARCKAQLKTF